MNNGIVNRLFLAALLFVCTDLCGQNVQIKTNLLYDATATINIGSECRLGRRWSLDLSGSYNGWKLGGDRKWKHWLVQPEGRYWFGSAFKGHYVGVHLHGGQMNLGHVGFGDHALREHYRQGWFYGCGVGYGYQWFLSRNWRMEAGLGLGYTRLTMTSTDVPYAGAGLVKAPKTTGVSPEYHCRLSTVYDITKIRQLIY